MCGFVAFMCLALVADVGAAEQRGDVYWGDVDDHRKLCADNAHAREGITGESDLTKRNFLNLNFELRYVRYVYMALKEISIL